jgi:DNA-binding GntR family transcriptional regulator
MGIKLRSYSDDAYQVLKSKIIEGDLDFGSRLHIGDLAEELGVSSTPVREALNRLSESGLAEITAHKGVFVVDPCERDVKELCEARLCLELCMAEAVIQNITPNQINILCELTTQTKYEMASFGVHDYCAEIAGNRVLQRLYSQVQGVLGVLFVKAIKKAKTDSYLAQHSEEEKQIVEAIEARDVGKLREIIRLHVKNIEMFLLAAKVAKPDP